MFGLERASVCDGGVWWMEGKQQSMWAGGGLCGIKIKEALASLSTTHFHAHGRHEHPTSGPGFGHTPWLDNSNLRNKHALLRTMPEDFRKTNFIPYCSFFFREMAQLKLAEQIIAEKDHDLHAVGYRADMAAMEKEALEEEIATLKTSLSNASMHDDHSTPSRVSP